MQDPNEQENPEENEDPKQLEKKERSLEEIESEIEEVDPTVLEGIPEPAKMKFLKVVRQITMEASHHIGPLPPAEEIKKYNEVIPNGAERIMQMAEKQIDHRIIMEKDYMKANNSDSRRGQLFAFIIAIICISASVYLGVNGQPWLGGVLGGGTITALVATFIVGKNKQRTQSDDPEE